MPAQFRIKDIRLLNAQYSLIKRDHLEEGSTGSEDEQDEKPIPVELVCSSHYEEEGRSLRVKVSAALKDPDMGFVLSAEFGGIFELDAELQEQEIKRIRNINCPAILFPYLRETLADLSRRAGLEPIHLPPVNFVSLHRRSLETKPKEE